MTANTSRPHATVPSCLALALQKRGLPLAPYRYSESAPPRPSDTAGRSGHIYGVATSLLDLRTVDKRSSRTAIKTRKLHEDGVIVARKIFINYRRDDAAANALSIAQYLENAFGAENVFIDVDRLRPGETFPGVLASRLAACEVMLAIIGPSWLVENPATGQPRINDPNDWVRMELEAAINSNIRIIPVLVGDARIPDSKDLPKSLQALLYRQAVRLTVSGFRYEMAGLVDDLRPDFASKPLKSKRKWRIMPIAFRLSIVSAVIAAFAGDTISYNYAWKQAGDWMRISTALRCANYKSDEQLNKHRNDFGLIDISRVGCADKTFLASMEEIRRSQPFDWNTEYKKYYDSRDWVNSGLSAFFIINSLGAGLIISRAVFKWVAGIKT